MRSAASRLAPEAIVCRSSFAARRAAGEVVDMVRDIFLHVDSLCGGERPVSRHFLDESAGARGWLCHTSVDAGAGATISHGPTTCYL